METNDPVTPLAAPAGSRTSSRIVHVLRTLFFVLVGLVFTDAMLRAAPSFWYVPAAVLLFLSAFFWLRPGIARIGASLTLPLCLALLFMLFTVQPWSWEQDRGIGFLGIVLMLLGVALCLGELYKKGSRGPAWAAVGISVVLLVVAFGVDRTFTNRVEIRKVQMSWLDDGHDPLGDKADTNAAGQKPVVLFVKVPNAFCYDAVFSEPLRKHLEELHKPVVTVEYNELSSWGRHMGYNLRSVEGLVFNIGRKNILPTPESYGGTLLTTGQDDKQIFTHVEAPAECPR